MHRNRSRSVGARGKQPRSFSKLGVRDTLSPSPPRGEGWGEGGASIWRNMEQYRQARITHCQLQESLDLSFDATEHLLKQRGL
jgi:hypothetical protein